MTPIQIDRFDNADNNDNIPTPECDIVSKGNENKDINDIDN